MISRGMFRMWASESRDGMPDLMGLCTRVPSLEWCLGNMLFLLRTFEGEVLVCMICLETVDGVVASIKDIV